MSKQEMVLNAPRRLSSDEVTDLARSLKALADPVRLRLVAEIAAHPGGQACVCDVSASFDLSQPTISHHLKVLRDAGILTSERRGTWVYYTVGTEHIRAVSGVIGGLAEVVGDPQPCEAER